MTPPKRLRAVCVAILMGTIVAPAAHACSVCLCGDPIAAAVGLEAPVRGTWTFTIENRSSSKSNALAPDGTEFEHENRVMTSAAYHLTDAVIVGATLPFLDRRIVENPAGDRTTSTHLGDLDLLARIDLDSRKATHTFRTMKLLLGATVPVGANDMTDADGVRLDQHAQTGTGAWGGSIGLGGLARSMQYWVYGSGIVRGSTRNAQGYLYGASFLLTAEVGRRVSHGLSLVGGIAARTTAHDNNHLLEEQPAGRVVPVIHHGNAGRVEDSGGRIAYVTPALHFTLSPRASLRTEAQFPVWQDLHGTQDEDPNLIVRFTYSP